MGELINILKFISKDNQPVELEYQNSRFIENNGLEVTFDANKYKVSDLSTLFPTDIFSAELAVKDVEGSTFSYHNGLICQNITLKVQENIIVVTLPGLNEEAKKYLELQKQIKQLQANLQQVVEETNIKL